MRRAKLAVLTVAALTVAAGLGCAGTVFVSSPIVEGHATFLWSDSLLSTLNMPRVAAGRVSVDAPKTLRSVSFAGNPPDDGVTFKFRIAIFRPNAGHGFVGELVYGPAALRLERTTELKSGKWVYDADLLDDVPLASGDWWVSIMDEEDEDDFAIYADFSGLAQLTQTSSDGQSSGYGEVGVLMKLQMTGQDTRFGPPLPTPEFLAVRRGSGSSAVVEFAGVLQESGDLRTWTRIEPQPASPFTVTTNEERRFFRIEP